MKENEQQVSAMACVVALAVTGACGLIGLLNLLGSNRKNEKAGYRLLQVARATGDVAKTVCRCQGSHQIFSGERG